MSTPPQQFQPPKWVQFAQWMWANHPILSVLGGAAIAGAAIHYKHELSDYVRTRMKQRIRQNEPRPSPEYYEVEEE